MPACRHRPAPWAATDSAAVGHVSRCVAARSAANLLREMRLKISSQKYSVILIELCCDETSILAERVPDDALTVRITAKTLCPSG